ncbi:gamma-soluble NSF attachment protein-like [Anopheles ziemanni]|uniref:gamma-soluble NSF attachment protein-like n=1 Tax=Anopheles coustani TaxID=139045 RepID=UPI00265A0CB0|nr:gamma-soluble NSF attachment protein-like [Anopheles coustani]XP_058176435.1 gamma-soluble NSF attachment protein-like [Anopheles ziemanni]
MSSKIEEAQEHIRQAEKCLKTSLLKWRPDYDNAAEEYNKAATCFRNAKSLDQCRDCLIKSSDCHRQNRALFHAAKCFDQAILISKEMNKLGDIRGLAERACNLYQQHGSPESGATVLDKAAKILEQSHPEDALQLFKQAVDVVTIEDSTRQGAEYASKVSRIMVKLGMYDQAADAIRREIGLLQQVGSDSAIGRLAVALVLVQLARGDYVAAEKAFKEWGNCCDAAEVQTLESLLQAYDDEDPELAQRALSSPFIRHMDIEYARLARDLPLPKGMAIAPKANVIENAAASYVSPNSGAAIDASKPVAGPAGDDEEDGGLC